MKPVRVLALIALAMPLLVCGRTPKIRILTPAAGASLTWAPLAISIDAAASADPDTLRILLNGSDISALFEVVAPPGGRVVADAVDVWGGWVLPGANQLRAEIEVSGVLLAREIQFDTEGDPYADSVQSFIAGSGAGFGDPAAVRGPPLGAGAFLGSLDVLALGLGGRIELAFDDNQIVDGPGVDFTVFENAFLSIDANLRSGPPFSEPARVSVSQDGISWFAFPCDLQPGGAPFYAGCAGVSPVFADANDPATPHAVIPSAISVEDLVGLDVLNFPVPEGAGGDSFDLAAVGLAWARFVRIESAAFDTPPSGANNKGFDLDAVSAVNSAPPDTLP